MSNSRFFEAVKDGDKKALKKSIKQGAPVDAHLSSSRSKDTGLIIAAREGHKDIIKELVSSGATVDLKNRNGWTALIAATSRRKSDAVKYLLSQGAKVELCDHKGDTALIYAVKEGHIGIIKELLSAGASVDQKNEEGQTSLMEACSRGLNDIVQRLLSHGAIVDMQDNNGNTALIFASGKGHVATVKVLVSSGATINLTNFKGNTALIVAARYGFTATVIELLSLGAPVDQTNHVGQTALMEACSGGQLVVVRELLSWGGRVDMQDKKGNTALMIAAGEGHIDIVRDLISAGTIVGLRNNEGKSAVMLARERSRISILPLLEKAGMYSTLDNDAGLYAQVNLKQQVSAEAEQKENQERHIIKKDSPDLTAQGKQGASPSIYPLLQSLSHPGITYFDEPQEKVFSSSGGDFDFDNGIEVSVPPSAVPPGSSFTLRVQPSFASSEVFELPQGIQSASPSYHLTGSGSELNGEMTLTVQHHIKVKSAKDSESLLFLRADSIPRGSDSGSVFEYKEVPVADTDFRLGENKGRFTTNKSSGFVKVGHRIKRLFSRTKSPGASLSSDTSEPPSPKSPSPDPNLYTVRVYKSPPQTTGDKIAIVGVSLYGRLYSKFLEYFDNHVIRRDYPEVSSRAVDRTVLGSLCLLDQQARLEVSGALGWIVDLDKDKISKREIDQPETENFKPEDLHDYPPKIVCRFSPEANPPERSTCMLSLSGFDEDVKINVPLKAAQGHLHRSVDTRKLQEAAERLKTSVIRVKETPLGSTVETIVALMERMTTALRSSSSLVDLVAHTDSITDEVQTVLRVSRKVAEECSIQTIRDNIEDSLSKMEALSHQLCQVTRVKLKHCQDQSEEGAALDDLVNSGANLLRAVDFLLKDIHTLNQVRSPSKTRPTTTADNVATTVGINPHQLDRQCSKDDLLPISRLIPNWLKLSIALGFTEHDINGIRTDLELTDYSMKSHRMLEQWLKRGAFTPESRYRRLVEASLNQSTPDLTLAADICKHVGGL